MVGLVDEVVEDSEGVLGGLVVGHRRAGLERPVVAFRSVGGTCVCDGRVLVGISGSGTPFGGEAGAGDAFEDGCFREVVEAGEDLDPPPDAHREDCTTAGLMGSLDSFAEVTRGMGKVAGADAHARHQAQGQPEEDGARPLAAERDALADASLLMA